MTRHIRLTQNMYTFSHLPPPYFIPPTAGEKETTSIHYDDEAIAALLDRSLDLTDGEGDIGQQNILANDYLSSFKVYYCPVYTRTHESGHLSIRTCLNQDTFQSGHA